MGSYLNPTSKQFQKSLSSQIHVDKSELISKVNKVIETEQNCLCVSRPRCFGKSMAANMLAAYYSYGKNTQLLFDGLKIAQADSYQTHLNQYNVLKIDMQDFLSAIQLQ